MGKLKDLYNKLFCKHDWEYLSHTTFKDEEGYFPQERWVHRCKKCGKIIVTPSTPIRSDRRWFL